jgi:hypothetical protein
MRQRESTDWGTLHGNLKFLSYLLFGLALTTGIYVAPALFTEGRGVAMRALRWIVPFVAAGYILLRESRIVQLTRRLERIERRLGDIWQEQDNV